MYKVNAFFWGVHRCIFFFLISDACNVHFLYFPPLQCYTCFLPLFTRTNVSVLLAPLYEHENLDLL